MPNIEVVEVTKNDYLHVVLVAKELMLDPNDALAGGTHGRKRVREIYSFDGDFNKIEWIKRLP